MSEPIRLEGCTPVPLLGYLKALGILRLLDEQKPEAKVRGWWEEDTFLLQTPLNTEDLRRFFLEEYKPTPLVGPWGARPGFNPIPKPKPGTKPNDPEAAARKALREIEDAAASQPRLEPFKRMISAVRSILADLRITEKPRDEDKLRLMQACRAEFPDQLTEWLDAVYVLTRDGPSFPPLLGTGGNDGSGSFMSAFAQLVVEVVIRRRYDDALNAALFATVTRDGYSDQSPGHFSPEDLTGVNPWDYILALEGCCLWAAGLVRRSGTAVGPGVAAFPFTVYPIAAGGPSLSGQDERKPTSAKREPAELWLPLWYRPARPAEIRSLLSEGRVAVGRRTARTGFDFALAAASLGVDRGIQAFQRFAFLQRNGQNFFATPLSRIPVVYQPQSHLIEEIRDWVDGFRRRCRDDTTPDRFGVAARRIDAAVFDYCKHGGSDRLADILRALGNAERELAVGDSQPSRRRKQLGPPFGHLSSRWLTSVGNSPEIRVARGIALIETPDNSVIPPLRAYLEPVERVGKIWDWTERSGSSVWSGDNLSRNLGAVLTRRLLDAEMAGDASLPLFSRWPVSLADVTWFLTNPSADRRIADLLWGFALVAPRADVERGRLDDQDLTAAPLPRAWALLKLTLLPGKVAWQRTNNGTVRWYVSQRNAEEGVIVRPEHTILARLRSGDVTGACDAAARRLRAVGLVPLPGPHADGSRRPTDLGAGGVATDRLLASLLFPITHDAVNTLSQMVLRRPTADTVT